MNSNTKILFYDRGDHLYIAEKLAEKAKVWSYIPILGTTPYIKDDQMGADLDGVERIDDFWKYVDKADFIVSPGCYDEEMFKWLHDKGHKVFSTMGSADIENNRLLFIQILEELGLPIPFTYHCEGLQELREYLKDKEDKWLKVPYVRGNFNTMHYTNMVQFENWLRVFEAKIGTRASEKIDILVQDSIEADCESGYDGFNINGVFTQNGSVGFEEKDKWYVCKVMNEPPKILKDINDAFEPIFKKYGCQGEVHTEVRITKTKEFFTDPTLRAGSPNGEMLCEGYENYAECIEEIANGKVPVPEPKDGEDKIEFIYGAEIILTSDWNEDNELCVQFPKEIAHLVKLKNHYKKGNAFYCLPNDNDGFFGAALGFGLTIDDAVEQANEVAEQVICEDLNYTPISMDKVKELIEKGHKHGIML